MKKNYLFAVKHSGVPNKPRLLGEVHQFHISKDAQYYIRRKAVEARHTKAKLLIISSDNDESIDSIRDLLERMDRMESNQFIRDNEVRV